VRIAEGLRFLFRRPLLCALVGAVAVNKLLTEAVFGIFVLYALHLGPAQYGLPFTAYALGGCSAGCARCGCATCSAGPHIVP
jgi:hypothetical protein